MKQTTKIQYKGKKNILDHEHKKTKCYALIEIHLIDVIYNLFIYICTSNRCRQMHRLLVTLWGKLWLDFSSAKHKMEIKDGKIIKDFVLENDAQLIQFNVTNVKE